MTLTGYQLFARVPTQANILGIYPASNWVNFLEARHKGIVAKIAKPARFLFRNYRTCCLGYNQIHYCWQLNQE